MDKKEGMIVFTTKTDESFMSKTITCPSCKGLNIIKNGFNRNGNKQRYKCKACHKQFVENGWRWFISPMTKELVQRLLLERISLRGICRVCGVSMSWLMSFISKLYEGQPEHLQLKVEQEKQALAGSIYIKLMKIEADEMWTFVGEKSNKKWLWLTLHTDSRQIITFHVGNRGDESARELWQKVPTAIKEICLVYSDDWDAYKGIIPPEKHCYSKWKGDTNHVERINNTFRQRISRLVRKSLSFSKSLDNHIGAIKYFICNYNLSLHL